MGDLAERITAHAESRPDAPALIDGTGTLSYRQLVLLADRQRSVLAGARLAGTAPVAILAHKDRETIAAVMDCLRQGRPFLLVSPLLPAATRAALLAESGTRGVLHAAEYRFEPAAGGASEAAIPADTAFMLTTSGSTGTPKVVLLGHGSVDRFTQWAAGTFGIATETTVMNLAPLNFDLSLLDVWATLGSGGCVVLVPPAKAVDGGYVLAQILEHGVEIVQGVPMFFQLLADATVTAPGARDGRSRLRHLILTGDEAPRRTLEGIRDRFPAATLHNIYGCTETNDSIMSTLAPHEPLPDRMPIGAPVAGADILLVDSAGREVSGAGEGELVASTPFLASGYLDPELSATKFIPHPHRPGAIAFRSGDLFRRGTDGSLSLLGRTDHQVKIRGVAVNTAEVERVLRLHQGVALAAVVTEADPVGGRRLLAVIERAAGSTVSALTSVHTAPHTCRGPPSRPSSGSRTLRFPSPPPARSTGKRPNGNTSRPQHNKEY